MLQGRNNSHKWQLDYLSPRDTSSSTRFEVVQLSTGPSGWVCQPTCCFHLLVLSPTKKIAHFSRYSLSHNIYGLKSKRTSSFSCQASFPLSLTVVVANPVTHCRMSSDNTKKKPQNPTHHVAAFSQRWERTCVGRAGWYPEHPPGPSRPAAQKLLPSPLHLPLSLRLFSWNTLSCSRIASNPREALGSI